MLLWFTPLAATVFVAAILRGLTGFGFALAAVPLISLVIEPKVAVASTILLQVMVGVPDLIRLRGSYDRVEVARLSLGALLGMPFGIAALACLNANATRLAIAAISLAGLGLMVVQPPRRLGSRPGISYATGALSGLFGSLAAMPGPPAVVYFVAIGASPPRARASMLIYFFLSALMALPGLALAGAIDGSTLLLSLAFLPFLLVGTLVGGRIFRLLHPRHYRAITLAVMALAAVVAGARAIAGMI
jgi:uncharacterized membrane protein YfcA